MICYEGEGEEEEERQENLMEKKEEEKAANSGKIAARTRGRGGGGEESHSLPSRINIPSSPPFSAPPPTNRFFPYPISYLKTEPVQ